MLIGMDWLEQHRVVLNCFDKTFTSVNNEGETITITRIPRKTTMIRFFALQLKKAVWKGCKAFVVIVINEEHTNTQDTLKIEYIPILNGYSYVFPKEIPRLPSKRELDFTIELVPGAVPNSIAPYRMNILELNELKSWLKELIDKNYIRPSVSPWGALVIFVKKKDGTVRLCIDYRQLNK